MYRWLNLTPHQIELVNPQGVVYGRIVSSGVARCEETREQVGTVRHDYPDPTANRGDSTAQICTIRAPLTEVHLGNVTGLPPHEGHDDQGKPWSHFIVSRIVAEALPERDDLVFPDDTVRDSQGRIIGCRALARLPKRST